jgi:hypothetical protein
MVAIKAVPEAQPDPKAGKPKSKGGMSVPYFNLSSSIEVAKVIHAKAGGRVTREQLAAHLKYKSKDNGAFMSRVTAAKMFGLIEQEGDQLHITSRGRDIAAPITTEGLESAKVAAFLEVNLFRAIYEELGGAAMPEEAGMRHLIERYGVITARVAPSVRILRESAEEAGFFKSAAGRMVLPSIGTGKRDTQARRDDAPSDPQRFGGGGGNGGGNFGDIDPAIIGLLKRLPPGGTPLPAARRKQLIEAFTATINYLYSEPESNAE